MGRFCLYALSSWSLQRFSAAEHSRDTEGARQSRVSFYRNLFNSRGSEDEKMGGRGVKKRRLGVALLFYSC